MVDRKDWGDGPWQQEPDTYEWVDEATGYECVIVRTSLGSLCGYVAVPPGHPAHGLHYDGLPEAYSRCRQRQFRAQMRAGTALSFMDRNPLKRLWASFLNYWVLPQCGPEPVLTPIGEAVRTIEVHGGLTYGENSFPVGEPAGSWVFGFDCGHAGDLVPALSPAFTARLHQKFPDLERLRETMEEHGIELPTPSYRTMPYVQTQCQSLAAQLSTIVKEHTTP